MDVILIYISKFTFFLQKGELCTALLIKYDGDTSMLSDVAKEGLGCYDYKGIWKFNGKPVYKLTKENLRESYITVHTFHPDTPEDCQLGSAYPIIFLWWFGTVIKRQSRIQIYRNTFYQQPNWNLHIRECL